MSQSTVRFTVLVLVAFCCLICSPILRADIPPPTPQIPGTHIPIPSTIVLFLCGLCLTGATALAGRISARKNGGKFPGWAKTAAFFLAVLTFVATIVGVVAEVNYANRLSRWSPGGYVPEPPPRPAPAEENVDGQAPVVPDESDVEAEESADANSGEKSTSESAPTPESGEQ